MVGGYSGYRKQLIGVPEVARSGFSPPRRRPPPPGPAASVGHASSTRPSAAAATGGREVTRPAPPVPAVAACRGDPHRHHLTGSRQPGIRPTPPRSTACQGAVTGGSTAENPILAALFKEMVRAMLSIGGGAAPMGLEPPLAITGLPMEGEKWRQQRIRELEVYLRCGRRGWSSPPRGPGGAQPCLLRRGAREERGGRRRRRWREGEGEEVAAGGARGWRAGEREHGEERGEAGQTSSWWRGQCANKGRGKRRGTWVISHQR
uniref:Uncharacterized protein n=1 Tax=Setaria viridis TaxID=4556 RepID=A0A4U6UN35_SETVI|nr:LOW QUALITY PROTEIN: hypothetical protein SEVIR_5G397700v2 [Setaria viridis]